MPEPPEHENKMLTWPDWPLKLRISSSHEEGVTREFAVLTQKFTGEKGQVKKLHCTHVDAKFKPVPGTEFEIEADLVLLAMYGVVGVGERKGKAFAITKMVEKPQASEAPSDLTITGRYILQPQIFELLEKQAAGAGGEIQLTDAMLALSRSQPFYGLEFEGRSFDCGSKIGFLAANIAYGFERADIAPELRAELRRLLGDK